MFLKKMLYFPDCDSILFPKLSNDRKGEIHMGKTLLNEKNKCSPDWEEIYFCCCLHFNINESKYFTQPSIFRLILEVYQFE